MSCPVHRGAGRGCDRGEGGSSAQLPARAGSWSWSSAGSRCRAWRRASRRGSCSSSWRPPMQVMGRPGLLVLAVGRGAPALELAIQRAAIDAQEVCRHGLVAVELLQHASDVAALDLVHGQDLLGLETWDADIARSIVADLLGEV